MDISFIIRALRTLVHSYWKKITATKTSSQEILINEKKKNYVQLVKSNSRGNRHTLFSATKELF